jgi:ribosomal protein S27AE
MEQERVARWLPGGGLAGNECENEFSGKGNEMNMFVCFDNDDDDDDDYNPPTTDECCPYCGAVWVMDAMERERCASCGWVVGTLYEGDDDE